MKLKCYNSKRRSTRNKSTLFFNRKGSSLLVMAGVALVLSGCGTKKYAMYSPEESNLQSLNRITDNEDNKFNSPFGGDDGKDLFYSVLDKKGSINIYHKSNPISNAMSPKTNGRNVNLNPTYSALIKQIAYSGRQDGAFVNDIFMMDVEQGVAIRRLTNTPNEIETHPCLSYDGKTIVYEKCYVDGRMKDIQIWRQDLQTESPTLLCQGLNPSFSHDGKNIVFVRFTPDGNNTCLVVMDVYGQNQTELTDAKMGLVENPRFSPDDKQIVFQCNKKDKRDIDLYVINRDGTGLTQLTFNKSYDAQPYWANDGFIYFSSDRGGKANNFQIWRFKYGNGSTNYKRFTPANSSTNVAPSSDQDIYHEVKTGETITQIAQRYGITVRDLVKLNGLQSMTLTQGMKLKINSK